ncbi:MAG: DUF1599 domain-containing protein [Muribaculaceae bacterium]|nr:DUF1599 domain-containing protein [Muribaculaceae bacterium]MDE6118496.1 DUF1599 domain-containing protein [Muribaculaceae bacterium]MDE6315293.1 DUF1599 domain-containing protein [Muribaculaceae bacterium]
MTTKESHTEQQFDRALADCRSLFEKKLHDYGAAWRVLRPASLTDQIFIKAQRIRSLQTKGCAHIDEGILSEFIGIVNYGLIGLIQLQLPMTDSVDITPEQAIKLYDEMARKARTLMIAKNHDYDEAWRSMRVSSYVDLILMKILRTRQIEDLCGATLVSEGIDANYLDMVNYSVFGIIKLTE